MVPVILSMSSAFITVHTLLISSRYLTFSVAIGKFHYCTFFQTATNVNYPSVTRNNDAYVQYKHLYIKALTSVFPVT
jgi:hypothetical protein